jgi:hypothetical protein
MRLLVAMTAALAALSLTAADTSRGGFPASKGRLLILSEDFAFAVPSLVRDNGDLVPVGLPLGIHGSAAVSPDGTRIAMVDTVPLFPGLTVPILRGLPTARRSRTRTTRTGTTRSTRSRRTAPARGS